MSEETFLFFMKLLTGILVGATLGSFITMLSYRLPRKLSIVAPGSFCPSCQTPLGVCDLVPVFSWLAFKGKCSHCGTAIGARYFCIELVSTAVVTLIMLGFGFSAVGFGVICLFIITFSALLIYLKK